MAATTANAIKAFLEQPSLALGVTCVRDRSDGLAYPFVEIGEGISKVPEPSNAIFDTGKKHIILELVQVDLWQQWKKADGTMNEQYGLADRIADALDGSRLLTSGNGAPPTHVYGVRVVHGPQRLPDLEPNVIRDTITAEIVRDRV